MSYIVVCKDGTPQEKIDEVANFIVEKGNSILSLQIHFSKWKNFLGGAINNKFGVIPGFSCSLSNPSVIQEVKNFVQIKYIEEDQEVHIMN